MPQYLLHIKTLTSRPSLTLSIQIILLTSIVTVFLLGFSWGEYMFTCCTGLWLYGSSEMLVVHWSCAPCTPSLMLPSHWTWLENWSAHIEDAAAAGGVPGTSGCMAAKVAAAGIVERLIKVFKFCPSSTTAWRKRACLGSWACGRAGCVCCTASGRTALSGLLAKCKPALSPDSKEGQQTPGWYKKKHRQATKGFSYW